MTIHQISLFLENKPGRLEAICHAMAEGGVNIVTLSLADTQSFGIVRLITDDWRRAADVLKEAGFSANVREVTAVCVPDRPGGMERVMKALGPAGVNIEYMYAFAARKGRDAVLVFRFDDSEKASAALESAGLKVLSEDDLPKAE